MRAAIEKIDLAPEASFQCFRRVELAFPFNWHYHPEFELTLIVAGRGRRFVGDHVDDYTPGDLVLLGSNVPHTWESARNDPAHDGKPHEAVVVQFQKTFLGDVFFDRPEMRHINRLLTRAARGARFIGPIVEVVADRLLNLSVQPPMSRLLGLLKLLQCLSESPQEQTQELASQRFAPRLAHADTQHIDRVVAFVHKRLDQTITQREAANLIDMSPSTFARFFRRVTGHTFIEYVNESRISEACRLLSDTELQVTDICYRAGFASLPYFNRRFKRSKQMCPRQYRRQFSR
jgi:AraC-like DNA-binding protein